MTYKKTNEERRQDAYRDGRYGFVNPNRTNFRDYHAQQQGIADRNAAQRDPSDVVAAPPWLLGIIALAVVIGIGFAVSGTGGSGSSGRAGVAAPYYATHYVVNPDAVWTHASGARQGRVADRKIVTPIAGKCLGLRGSISNGEVRTVLEDYYGREHNMVTSAATFAPLPEGAKCDLSGYYKP